MEVNLKNKLELPEMIVRAFFFQSGERCSSGLESFKPRQIFNLLNNIVLEEIKERLSF
jgi:hypothetical protein